MRPPEFYAWVQGLDEEERIIWGREKRRGRKSLSDRAPDGRRGYGGGPPGHVVIGRVQQGSGSIRKRGGKT